jgi:hypothetical protein
MWYIFANNWSKRFEDSQVLELTVETRHDKFVRLAEGRANRVISAIRSISNLSNRNHYDFSEQEVKVLIHAIKREVDIMQTTFNSSLGTKQKNHFKFTTKLEADK